MSNKYFAGNKGQYIFCDLCGQAVYAFEAKKLSTATGRPGLIVCPRDADSVDPSLLSYNIPTEKSPPFVRTNHTNVSNGATPLDYETTTALGA